MKVNRDPRVKGDGPSHKCLRKIERELGVFIDIPVNPLRTSNQQFGIYDEDEAYAGDICAEGPCFSEEELRTKIVALFPQQ